MEVLLWYLLFAVTTSLTAQFELIRPVLSDLALLEPEHNMVQNRSLSVFTTFIMGIMAAPGLIFRV